MRWREHGKFLGRTATRLFCTSGAARTRRGFLPRRLLPGWERDMGQMEATTSYQEGGTTHIHVTVNLLEVQESEQQPNAVAYAFSANGHLLTQAPVDAKGNATLSFAAARDARAVRVLVGPPLEER